MRNYTLYIYKYSRIAATLVLAVTLAGCAADTPDESAATPSGPHFVTLGVSYGQAESIDWMPEVSSRAAGVNELPATMPDVIGTYGYNNLAASGLSYSGVGEIFANVPMVYYNSPDFDDLIAFYNVDTTKFDYGDDPEQDHWLYPNPVEWHPTAQYLFFAYAPYASASVEGNESVMAQERSFDGFDRVIWSNIPRFCPEDHMLSNKIIFYQSKSDGSRDLVQNVFMKHLQARLRFCFKIGPEFAKQRIIKVKSMEVINLRGRSLTMRADYDRFNIVNAKPSRASEPKGYILKEDDILWTYNSDVDESNYNISLHNERDPNTNREIPEIELSAATAAEKGYQPLASVYVYPGDNLGNVQIRVTYDVYDLQGQLLRLDDSAVNTLDLSSFVKKETPPEDMLPGLRRLCPGYYYDINIRIEPLFLYVLSDNDQTYDGQIFIDVE